MDTSMEGTTINVWKQLREDLQKSEIKHLFLVRLGLKEVPEEEVPHWIGATILELQFNALVSLRNISPLTTLQVLDVKSNMLQNLEGIFRLTSLQKLSIGNNPIKDLPEDISQLQELTELRAEKCSLSSIPNCISSLKNLTLLFLQDNEISDATPILSISSLQNVSLRRNKLTSFGSNTAACTSLTKVDLSFNTLTSFPNIENCIQLKDITLSYNNISDVPQYISQLTCLNYLQLDNNDFKIWPKHLGKLSDSVSNLDIAYNDLDQFDDSFLSTSKLKNINLLGSDVEKDIGGLQQKYPHIAFRKPSPRDIPSLILPNLYLGNYMTAINKNTLNRLKITHILTVAADLEPAFPQLFKYHVVRVEDVDYEDLKSHFEKCIEFIDEGRQAGGCLVHCAAGVSRSATVTIAYVMKHKKMSYEQAHEFVLEKRPVIFPNFGFRKQLKDFESTIEIQRPHKSKSSKSSKPSKCIVE